MKKKLGILISVLTVFSLTACSFNMGQTAPASDIIEEEEVAEPEAVIVEESSVDDTGVDSQEAVAENDESAEPGADTSSDGYPAATPGKATGSISAYTDKNGDTAIIPAQFTVSKKDDEQTINTGLVIIGPDGSEFVWVPTTVTPLTMRDFGSYFMGGGSFSGYYDETNLPEYQAMVSSTEKYGGFYIGRFEASRGKGNVPLSKRVTDKEKGTIWVRFSPQDTTVACQNLYADNDTVQGFFPWGANWDTTLQWLIDSGCKTEAEIRSDSTGWGNYSDDSFSEKARGNYTGMWEEAKANNIYDLAGDNWEWTQERCGSNYVMRGGGYNLMGGSCPGSRYPAALRDPLPGNNHHPNVTFRAALYIK